MSMITLKCPKCGAEAKLSLADTSYSGPRRCWKCHEFFTITIYNNQVTSCEPLSKEEYERQQEAKKAAEKSRGGINFSRQAQLEFPQNSQGDIDSSKQEDTDIFKILAGKSGGGIDFSKQAQPEVPPKTPDKPREFIRPTIPQQPASQTKPEKSMPIFPPDRIQTFVPLEDINEEPETPQKPPQRQRDYTKPLSHKEPSSQTKPEKPSSVFPPDRIQTFVPLEDIDKEPEKPKKATPGSGKSP